MTSGRPSPRPTVGVARRRVRGIRDSSRRARKEGLGPWHVDSSVIGHSRGDRADGAPADPADRRATRRVRLGAALDRAGPSAARRGRRARWPGSGPLGVPLDARRRSDAPRRRHDRLLASRRRRSRWPRSAPRAGIPLVVGTTGFEPEQRRELEAAAATIPLLISPNLSRAVNLLMRLVGEAARALGDAADIEIVERHHHFKKDAPSGTALRLAEIVGQAIGVGPVRPRPAGPGRRAAPRRDRPPRPPHRRQPRRAHRRLRPDGRVPRTLAPGPEPRRLRPGRSTPPGSSPASRPGSTRWRRARLS